MRLRKGLGNASPPAPSEEAEPSSQHKCIPQQVPPKEVPPQGTIAKKNPSNRLKERSSKLSFSPDCAQSDLERDQLPTLAEAVCGARGRNPICTVFSPIPRPELHAQVLCMRVWLPMFTHAFPPSLKLHAQFLCMHTVGSSEGPTTSNAHGNGAPSTAGHDQH